MPIHRAEQHHSFGGQPLPSLPSKELSPKGNAYAWGGTGLRICEPHLKEAQRDTTGDFVSVDLCSAFPMLSQIFRERHREWCFEEARRVFGLVSQSLESQKQSTLPNDLRIRSISQFNEQELRRLRTGFSPKKALPRKLGEAALLNILYIPERSFDITRPSEVAYSLFQQFISKTNIYQRRFEREEAVGKGRWQIIEPVDVKKTLKEALIDVVGEKHVHTFLEKLVAFCSQKLPPLRKFSFISLDIEDKDLLRAKAKNSFPSGYLNTEFFKRIGEMEGHKQADLFSLPQLFPPESVSFYSSIEGWPFYFGESSFDQHCVVANAIAKTLQPGGRAVMFPWNFENSSNHHEQLLLMIEDYWKSLGLQVEKEEKDKESLIRQMRDRELNLVELSPVFKGGEQSLTVLVLKKI